MQAEPVRHLGRSQCTQDAYVQTPPIGERQQHQLKFEPLALDVVAARARDRSDTFLRDHGKEFAELLLAFGVPEVGKGFAAQLAAEGRADAGTGNAERMTG